MNTKKIGIYIFRRDLRLHDNLGLMKLCGEVDLIIPIFILDKYQIIKSKHNKHYFSNNAVQFICESIIDLNNYLSKQNSYLRLYFGTPFKIIDKLINWIKDNITSNIILGYNADYSEYAKKRDQLIDKIATKHNVTIIKCNEDFTLIPFNVMIKSDGSGFKQFGAFYKNAKKHIVNKPSRFNFDVVLDKTIKTIDEFNIDKLSDFYQYNKNLAQNGGRIEGFKKLKALKKYNKYNELRNRLDYQTTNISGYLNIGCISIREAYYMIKKYLRKSDLIKQLYWRDFYLQALIYLENGSKYFHMDQRYEKIKWKNDEKLWNKLINSQTGFLIIDAAMNELKTTGFMHNRARMIVGTFWTKYLLINVFHPIYGSQVGFSKYLLDAIGPSQNKFNNQWLTEFDFPGKKYAPRNAPIAGRPMDISNRMISKWDPNCEYIKKWLPHLRNIDNEDIIRWKGNNTHPGPIFDPKEKYMEWINACKNI